MTTPFEADRTGGDSSPGQMKLDIAIIIRQHHADVYRYAYRLCGNTVDAEDLCQQTFLTAQEKLDQVRDARKVRSWLFTILRNGYLRQRSQCRPRDAGSLDLELDSLAQASVEVPVDEEWLQMALDKLPDEFKVVLLLFYFEECSYKEIATRLDLKVGTVMSRLSRAKCRLRHELVRAQRGEHAPTSSPDTDVAIPPSNPDGDSLTSRNSR